MSQPIALTSGGRMLFACVMLLFVQLASPALAQELSSVSTPPATPAADHDQHLFSPDIAALLTTDTNTFQPMLATDVITLLDAAIGNNLRPRESGAAFRQLPLTEAEFAQIAANVAPYLR